jgi:hypothetical protein
MTRYTKVFLWLACAGLCAALVGMILGGVLRHHARMANAAWSKVPLASASGNRGSAPSMRPSNAAPLKETTANVESTSASLHGAVPETSAKENASGWDRGAHRGWPAFGRHGHRPLAVLAVVLFVGGLALFVVSLVALLGRWLTSLEPQKTVVVTGAILFAMVGIAGLHHIRHRHEGVAGMLILWLVVIVLTGAFWYAFKGAHKE